MNLKCSCLLIFFGFLPLTFLTAQHEEVAAAMEPVYILARAGNLPGAKALLEAKRDSLTSESTPFYRREVLLVLGQVAYSLREFGEAAAALRACLNVEVPDNPMPALNLAGAYDVLGWSLYITNELAESRESLGEGYRVAKEGLGDSHPLTLQLMAKYGKMQNETSNHEEGKQLLSETLELVEQFYGSEFGLLGFIYQSLGETYAQLGQDDSTLIWQQRAIDFQEATIGLVHHNVFSSYNEKAWSLREMGKAQEAFETMQIVLDRIEALEASEREDFLVFYKTALGHALEVGACEEAQKIASYLESMLRRPDREEIPYFSTKASFGELHIFLAKYRMRCEGNKPDRILQADSLIQQVPPIFQDLFSELTNRETVVKSASLVNGWMQQCLDVLWSPYQQGITQPETLFGLIEQAQGFSYVKQRAFWRSLAAESVPDSLRNALKAAEGEILSLDQRIQQAAAEDKDSLQSLRVNLYRERDRLSSDIRALSKDYLELSQKMDRANLADIQEELGPDEGILSYFIGDTLRIALVITADAFTPVRLPVDGGLFEQIDQFRLSLYAPYLVASTEHPNYRAQSTALGLALYDQLVAPLASFLPKRLTIIPSHKLSLLPFEAMISAETDENLPYSEWPFLLKKYTLSYAFSATQWLDSRRSDQALPKGELLAVAPDFSTQDQLFTEAEPMRQGYLGPLPFAQSEVETLLTLFDGKSLTGPEATLQAFQELASQYRILHLATHGKVNEERSDFSFLAFYGPQDSLFLDEQQTVYGISPLYFSDLYRMLLPSEMVVLSACETGIGKVYLGEGLASIAQGFSYAGAQSVVTTLWSVNDQQTTRFMEAFYADLKAGKRKDEALRNAKLQMLGENASPFFWAGYVGVGNMQPLQQQGLSFWTWCMIFFGLVFGGALFWRMRR